MSDTSKAIKLAAGAFLTRPDEMDGVPGLEPNCNASKDDFMDWTDVGPGGTISRRHVINMMPAIAAVPTIGFSGISSATTEALSADADLFQAWQNYLAVQAEIHGSAPSSDEEADAEADRLTAAENAILRATATTVQGAMIKLWVALPYEQYNRWVEEAVARQDFETIFARESELDFALRLKVHALMALAARQG